MHPLSVTYTETREQSAFLMEQPFADALDRNSGALKRRASALVFNNTTVLSDQAVLTARAGGTRLLRRGAPGQFDGGPLGLGFNPSFATTIAPEGGSLFPRLSFQNFTSVGRSAGESERYDQPYAFNVAVSTLAGRHTFKIGADVRRLSATVATEPLSAGSFSFNGNFTRGPEGDGGYDFASFLVGAPRSASQAPSNRGELEVFTRYLGAYVQDDWRLSPKLTVNYGVRLEREDGLQEVDNRFTVGFDPDAVSPLDALVPASARLGTPLEGRTIRGGLIFAGIDGANLYQGDPPKVIVSPRAGLTYAFNDRTVVRTGYGLYIAPWNYSATQHGQIGFTRTTSVTQGAERTDDPLTTLDDPFPGGLEAPIGSSLGLLTGVGDGISFVDPSPPSVQPSRIVCSILKLSWSASSVAAVSPAAFGSVSSLPRVESGQAAAMARATGFSANEGMTAPANSGFSSVPEGPVAGHRALATPSRQNGLKMRTAEPLTLVVEKSPTR